MKEITVNRSSEGIFNYQGWPTVTKDEHGTLYVACSGHRLAHICMWNGATVPPTLT